MAVVRTTFDWLNVYFAIPIAVIGFGIAIWQVIEAKRAANKATTAAEAAKDAAKEASDSARARFRDISVSAIASQLVLIENAVNIAVDKRQSELLSHVVVNWHWEAGRCREFLDGGREEEKKVMTLIQTSITAATALKQKILSFDSGTDWVKETQRIRKAMGEVTAHVGELTAHQSVKESA